MVKPVFCVLGPTASGKTKLVMALADKLPIDIISVDSAMVYQQMAIGTAKPTVEELLCYPHQLINLIEPDGSYSAAQFVRDVDQCINKSFTNQRIPVLVGGTMMYFQAIQIGLSELPGADESLRSQLLEQGEAKGWPYLHQTLAEVDAITATRIHPHDKQRISRALEVYYLTGKPLSHLIEENRPLPYRFENILLLPKKRAWLHQCIAERFSTMLKEGLVTETKSILEQWPNAIHSPSMRMVGYRQVYRYLQGQLNESELLDKGVAATRQLAKRQITWLRRWPYGRIMMAEQEQNRERIVAIVEEIMDNWV
ncbi:tRNA (adenosine(37)-N6)-dimethylallyltransferase MiaA [Legionella sp. W05-934-2]|uniref:tRNA (adenosine(37)-N6)-dimethylallyltransferase MiaA n=1 Tax=Legionella sp. W05-934-2 TaxID=1198649 RepID=UPI003461964F